MYHTKHVQDGELMKPVQKWTRHNHFGHRFNGKIRNSNSIFESITHLATSIDHLQCPRPIPRWRDIEQKTTTLENRKLKPVNGR